MSFDAGSIKSAIGIDVGPFAVGMLQATSIAQLFPSTVTQFIANPLLAIVGIAEQAAGAIKAAFFNVSESAHEISLEAQRAGVSVSYLERIGDVAKQEGLGIEELAHSFAFLNRNATEARQGNETAMTSFQRLGVSLYDAAGHAKNSQQLFLDVADAIARVKGTGLDTEGAMDLLSRAGIQMLPLLQQGSAAINEVANVMHQASGGMSDDLADIAGKAVRLGYVWEGVWEGVQRAVATPILRIVAAHAGELQAAMIAAGASIRSGIGVAFEYLESRAGRLQSALAAVASAMRDGVGPAFAFVASQAAAVQTAFTSIASAVGTTTAFVREHAATFIGALLPIGTVVLGPYVLGALTAFGGVVAAVFGAITSPLGIAIAGFAALGAAIGNDRLQAGFAIAVAGVRQGVEWIASTAVPVIRQDLTSAMAAVAPYAVAFGQAMQGAWQHLTEGVSWIRSTAIPVIGSEFAAAWTAISPAVAYWEAAMASVRQVLRDVWSFISGSMVPLLRESFAAAMSALSPIVAAVRDAFATLAPVMAEVYGVAKQAFGYLAGVAIDAMTSLFGGTAAASGQLSTFSNFALVAGHAVGVVIGGALRLATPLFVGMGETIGFAIRLLADFIKYSIEAAIEVGKLVDKLGPLIKYGSAIPTLGLSLLTSPSPAAQPASSPVSATWNALAAPGAANSIPQANAGGGGSNALAASLAPAATVASDSLQVMNTRVSPVNDLLQTLSSNLTQLNPQFSALISSAAAASSATPSTASSPSPLPAAQSGLTINGGINVPPLDVSDASSQIAAKLVPVIRAAVDQQRKQLDAAAQAGVTQGGL